MKISFSPLQIQDFPLLLRWLNSAHVKEWWDKIDWTKELIEAKYLSYTKGYKTIAPGNNKSIHAFIICYDDRKIGYIQYYNRHDFLSEYNYNIVDIPKSTAALDFYIGEKDFLGRGIGAKALKLFAEEYIFPKFDNLLVDPDTTNKIAIKSYEKTGFHIWKKVCNNKISLMIRGKI
ncbi:MAG UNVERIFIED_CONTAM: acetyltransferase [Rickettsiaceae bacterium]|jgi:aminoglycoside 6'-N-acetyltransferase